MEVYFPSYGVFKAYNDASKQLHNPHTKPKAAAQVAEDFYNLLNRAIDRVNSAQLKREALTLKFITGELPNLHDLLIAGKEAEFLFSLAVTLTNKFIRAYEELMALHV